MVVRSFAFLAFLVCCSISDAEEAVEIPLSEIWAHGMPGTKKILELDTTPKIVESLMGEIGKKLSTGGWDREADEAFAVEGVGLQALNNAHGVISGKKPRSTSFNHKHEVSIVFFTLYTGCYIHLTKVEKTKNDFHVVYELIPHETKDLSQHFAIIPVGKLREGKFKVRIAAKPPGPRFAEVFVDHRASDALYKRNLGRVSSSFEFSVR